MEFGVVLIGNVDQNKSDLIYQLSIGLKSFFKERMYGNDIKMYTIGIVCVAPQFDQFFTTKKPKYIKGKKTIHPEGMPFTVEDSLEYDVKLDFETFKNGTEEENKRLLAKEILSSLSVLDTMKSKIKDFDAEKFKADLENYFKEKGLV